MSLSVFICEDHQIVIDGVTRILSNSGIYAPIHAFKSGNKLLEALEKQVPDILILDLNLPDRNGIELLPEIKTSYPELSVLILTMHSDALIARKVKDLGADGYLLKDFGEKELLLALKKVTSGEYFASPVLNQTTQVESDNRAFFLTTREKEIISLTALGKSSTEIGDAIHISPHTVNTHRRNIYKKLGISNMKELVTFAHAYAHHLTDQ
ncbi:MAG: response regulator transcription factor [Balneolales bacterium]|nr:response regulator transcription factor [Balneolales bacterium]